MLMLGDGFSPRPTASVAPVRSFGCKPLFSCAMAGSTQVVGSLRSVEDPAGRAACTRSCAESSPPNNEQLVRELGALEELAAGHGRGRIVLVPDVAA